MNENERIRFIDYLRVFACFMVMLVHSCEPFYLGGEGTLIASRTSGFWATFLDSPCRAAVPLFAIASGYLLFPLRVSTGAFFRRRFVRVFVPLAIWTCVYCVLHGGWARLPFNFPDMDGHLWFVYMLFGLYLLMPLLSPWAEKATEKEVRLWLLLWLFTTFFPYIRKLQLALLGDPSFGAVPFLWGECPWNPFGAFHYVSGFFGYMLLGFYFRRFVPPLSRTRTFALAIPLMLVGFAIAFLGSFCRLPADAAAYPFRASYAFAVDLETSWEFCSFGIALTVLAWFILFRRCEGGGAFYRFVIRPLSEASYGTYLLHMLILSPVSAALIPRLPVPAAILGTAVLSFLGASLAGLFFKRLPLVGRFIAG